jgi:hypothetical protein
MAPANAKDATSNPNNFKMDCPKNKKPTINAADIIVAFSA